MRLVKCDYILVKTEKILQFLSLLFRTVYGNRRENAFESNQYLQIRKFWKVNTMNEDRTGLPVVCSEQQQTIFGTASPPALHPRCECIMQIVLLLPVHHGRR
jgi:hypothetical protein